ncbi:MAG TPA: hypothetical protein VIV40_21610 [Kofleriaceae bacterium]
MPIFGALTVLADDTPPPAPPPDATKSASALSVDDMRLRSEEMMKANESSYRELLHLKEQAKKQKDVIKLNCINDKLVQLKAQITITEETNTQLQASLTSSNDDRYALFVKLSTDNASVTRIRDEGRACIGEPELYKQESGVDVTRPDIPDDPGTIDPYDPGGVVVIEPPGYASPYN